MMKNIGRHFTPFQLITMGFAAVILFGAFLLTLPISSVEGVFTPFHKALFTSTSAVCELLVFLWTACYFNTDPDRWAWRGDSYGFGHIVVREKDFSYAAHDNAGCHCSAKDRRNCPTDEVYIKRNISGRAYRSGITVAGFRKRFWREGNLDVNLSFYFCILQCGI